MEERVRLSSNGHFSTPEMVLCTHLIGGMSVPIAQLNAREEIIYRFPTGNETFSVFSSP